MNAFSKAPILLFCAFAVSRSDGEEPVVRIFEKRRSDGQLTSTESFYTDAQGKNVLHGLTVDYGSNGQKRRETEYRHGRRHGPVIEWSWTGYKMLEGQYLDGQMHGTWTEWYSSGSERSQCTYAEGRILGNRHFWNRHGQKVQEERHDPMSFALTDTTRWHDNGQMAMHGSFQPRRRVDNNALLEAIQKIKDPSIIDDTNNKEVTKIKQLWKEIEEQTKDHKHGKWTYWDQDGNVYARGIWKEGEPWDGICAVLPPHRGSVLPPEYFARFEEGKEVERLPELPPRGN